MFGETISPDPRIASPWTLRLSNPASTDTSASTTAPATPPHLDSHTAPAPKADLPPLELLSIDQYSTLGIDIGHDDDAQSDVSEEADGFFSLEMDVSIDRQLSNIPDLHKHASSAARRPLQLHSASPLMAVGRDRIVASRASTSGVSPHFGPIAPEVDQKGNLEYKLKILPPSRERFDRLVTQLKWRLLEGGGLAVYEIGVLDDGTLIGLDADSMKDSLKLLSLMAAEVGATCEVQRVLSLEQTCDQGDVSLRAFDEVEATLALEPHSNAVEALRPALYKFNLAAQQIPTTEPSPDVETCEPQVGLSSSHKDLSAQNKRKQQKAEPDNAVRSTGRGKRDILAGKDQANIVYLPSKEEKRIQRAAAAEAELDVVPIVSGQPHNGLDKMVWVADSIQPKTARAKARARKTQPLDVQALSTSASSISSMQSSPSAASPLAEPVPMPNMGGAYSGYENVMAELGVLSERAARALGSPTDLHQQPAYEPFRCRLIVEAVVRREANSADNFIDYQGVSSSFKLT